jgi:hypothetical protein
MGLRRTYQSILPSLMFGEVNSSPEQVWTPHTRLLDSHLETLTVRSTGKRTNKTTELTQPESRSCCPGNLTRSCHD